MKYNIDSFYTDGKLHGHKGEDYAIHGVDYFIICDGCSSSNHSDVVARIQAHIAKELIVDIQYREFNIENTIELSKMVSNRLQQISFQLSIKGMPLSTLIIGTVIDNLVRVIVIGDGTIVFKDKNQKQQTITISYTNNAPFYPYYYLSDKLINKYLDNYPKEEKIIQWNYFFTNSSIIEPSIFEFFFRGFRIFIYFFRWYRRIYRTIEITY